MQTLLLLPLAPTQLLLLLLLLLLLHRRSAQAPHDALLTSCRSPRDLQTECVR